MTPRLLLFDLYGGGHHGMYLDVLRAYWAEQGQGEVHVAVGRDFIRRHPAVVEAVRGMPGATLHELADPPGGASLLALDRLHRRELGRLIRETEATYAVAMYWDHAQLATAFGLRFDRPVRLAGIYFRPSFHYSTLVGSERPSLPERLTALRKRLVLRAALRNPHLDTLFSLDPFVVPHINRVARRDVAVALPDPVRVPAVPGDSTAPTDGRRRLLVFGVLDHRKGILPICAALARLSPGEQCDLALTLAGPLEAGTADEIRAALDRLGAQTDVRVTLDDRFVPDAEIQHLIAQSDLVLLTYQRHVGSSNVLVRAAAAGVPVLASDYGLVGAQVRAHALGITVDAADADAIAAGLRAWLRGPEVGFDADRADAFFRANTAHAYAETIFTRLTRP